MSGSQAIDSILNVKYTLPNGELAAVITKSKKFTGEFDCLLCSAYNLRVPNLIQHVNGRRHLQKVDLVDVETDKAPLHALPRFKETTPKLTTLIVKSTDKAVIGMEYIIEVHSTSNMGSSYHCVLCTEIFNLISRVVEHLTSYKHRTEYLKTLFPRVFEEVSQLIELVSKGIEDEYGRLNPITVERNDFLKNKEKLIAMASSSKHVNRNIGCWQLIKKSGDKDMNERNEGERLLKRCSGITSISSESSRSSTGTKQDEISLSSSSTATVARNDSKLENFWLELAAAKNESLKAYQPFISNPPSYPGYVQLWETFWKTRYQELRVGDKLKAFDWQAEWAAEWRKLMKEKIKLDIEAKCAEIKRKLGIADAHLSEIDKIKLSTPVLLVSDDEQPTSQLRRRSRSPKPSPQPRRKSRSRSPLSRSAQNQKTTTATLPTLSLNKNQTPLRLEQLLEKHKHSGDFLISWRELLSTFEIEDSDRAKTTGTSAPPTYPPVDNSAKSTDRIEVDESIEAVQELPAEPPAKTKTIISVLRVLTALENMLGSLGPKLIYLLQTAIAMDKSNAHSSETLLYDNNNCILFETIQEKLKGLLIADLVEPNLRNVVKKAIRDMTYLIDQAAVNSKNFYMQPPPKQPTPPASFERKSPQADACTYTEETILPPEHVLPSAEINNDATDDEDGPSAVTLEDYEIKVLLEKFINLSDKDKCNFTSYLSRLKATDPDRIMRLQSESAIQIPELAFKVCKLEPPLPRRAVDVSKMKTPLPEPANKPHCTVETMCIDLTSSENASYYSENDEETSIAYRVAKKNSGAKIKRRTRNSIA